MARIALGVGRKPLRQYTGLALNVATRNTPHGIAIVESEVNDD